MTGELEFNVTEPKNVYAVFQMMVLGLVRQAENQNLKRPFSIKVVDKHGNFVYETVLAVGEHLNFADGRATGRIFLPFTATLTGADSIVLKMSLTGP